LAFFFIFKLQKKKLLISSISRFRTYAITGFYVRFGNLHWIRVHYGLFILFLLIPLTQVSILKGFFYGHFLFIFWAKAYSKTFILCFSGKIFIIWGIFGFTNPKCVFVVDLCVNSNVLRLPTKMHSWLLGIKIFIRPVLSKLTFCILGPINLEF
jgi:hypothetical protein